MSNRLVTSIPSKIRNFSHFVHQNPTFPWTSHSFCHFVHQNPAFPWTSHRFCHFVHQNPTFPWTSTTFKSGSPLCRDLNDGEPYRPSYIRLGPSGPDEVPLLNGRKGGNTCHDSDWDNGPEHSRNGYEKQKTCQFVGISVWKA